MPTLYDSEMLDFPIPLHIHARDSTYFFFSCTEYGTLIPSLMNSHP